MLNHKEGIKLDLLKISVMVRNKIAVVKGLHEASVLAESSIRDDLGVTSMEYITILTDVAMVLGIDLMRFSEREIVTARTVGDLECVIASKLPQPCQESI